MKNIKLREKTALIKILKRDPAIKKYMRKLKVEIENEN